MWWLECFTSLVHSRLRSLNHCGLILGLQDLELVRVHELISTGKNSNNRKPQSGYERFVGSSRMILSCEEKAAPHTQCCLQTLSWLSRPYTPVGCDSDGRLSFIDEQHGRGSTFNQFLSGTVLLSLSLPLSLSFSLSLSLPLSLSLSLSLSLFSVERQISMLLIDICICISVGGHIGQLAHRADPDLRYRFPQTNAIRDSSED